MRYVLTLVLLAAIRLSGQTTTGTAAGDVTDSSGAAVPDPAVSLVKRTARGGATLMIRQVSESVAVSGRPVLIESDTSSLGQVISNRQVAGLPLNGVGIAVCCQRQADLPRQFQLALKLIW
jgi:hypothetical protein